MSRLFVIAFAVAATVGLSACGTIGKGKGKAPPPAPAPVPMEEPLITK